MNKYKVELHYENIVVDAESASEALKKVRKFIGGDSFLPKKEEAIKLNDAEYTKNETEAKK